ncbi:MAG: NUDIX hydrolase [Actinomycetota bacterium]|nr:NUDIX hydrolase [Actinomycetota bacterium]
MTDDAPVRAAGGVVWRRGDGGRVEVAVVHRPKYDDWSLPKGKLDPGENEQDAALREVEEETGLRCRLGPELAGTEYRDRYGRPKTVRYWSMSPVDGSFTPNREIDEVRWLPLDEASGLLTYERDRSVLGSLPPDP